MDTWRDIADNIIPKLKNTPCDGIATYVKLDGATKEKFAEAIQGVKNCLEKKCTA